MNFLIGFPVDLNSPEESFIVLVSLEKATEHRLLVKNQHGLYACSPGLPRTGSGADFIWQKVRGEYCFKFISIGNNFDEDITPSEIATSGTSDACACALACKQYPDVVNDNNSIILVSCGLYGNSDNIDELSLERVTKANDPTTGAESLYRKWYAANRYKAIALMLHEQDATLLVEYLTKNNQRVNSYPLVEDIFQNLQNGWPNIPSIISCKPKQMPLLAKLIKEPHEKQTADKPPSENILCEKAYNLGIALAQIPSAYYNSDNIDALEQQTDTLFSEMSLPNSTIQTIMTKFIKKNDNESFIKNLCYGELAWNTISGILKTKLTGKVAAAFGLGYNLVEIQRLLEYMPWLIKAGIPNDFLYNTIEKNFQKLIKDAELVGIREESIDIMQRAQSNMQNIQDAQSMLASCKENILDELHRSNV